MKLLSCRGATEGVALFQHERFQTSLGEIEGCDEGIMPAADDDDIARSGQSVISTGEFCL